MRSLYLHDTREAPHPLLAEAIWDMMRALSLQLRAEPLDAFSRSPPCLLLELSDTKVCKP